MPWTPLTPASKVLVLEANRAAGFANGDPVGLMPDASGNGRDATASGGQRPTYRTGGVAGQPYIEFDGNDVLVTPPATLDRAYTVLAVVSDLPGGGDRMIVEFSANANAGGWAMYRRGDNKLELYHSTNPSVWTRISQATLTSGPAWVFGVGDRNATPEVRLWLNGSESGTSPVTNDTSAAFGTQAMYIGARGGASLFTPMKLYLLAVYSGALSDADRDGFNAYVYNTYGLGTPPVPVVTLSPDTANVFTLATLELTVSVQNSATAPTWTVSGGTLSGSGNTRTWTAPNAPGVYTVTVSVDGVSDSSSITVAAPPVVSLTPDVATVYTGATLELTASVQGSATAPTWTISGGSIFPGGNTRTWTAPSTPGVYTVTVSVDGISDSSTITVTKLPTGISTQVFNHPVIYGGPDGYPNVGSDAVFINPIPSPAQVLMPPEALPWYFPSPGNVSLFLQKATVLQHPGSPNPLYKRARFEFVFWALEAGDVQVVIGQHTGGARISVNEHVETYNNYSGTWGTVRLPVARGQRVRVRIEGVTIYDWGFENVAVYTFAVGGRIPITGTNPRKGWDARGTRKGSRLLTALAGIEDTINRWRR